MGQWLVLGNILLATFLAIFSATATIISGEMVQGDLALSEPLVQWVTILYFLGVNTVVPAANWFGVRYGMRRVYSIGIWVFAAGSLIAGMADSFAVFAPARFIEGLGGGIVFPVGMAIIGARFPKEQLSLALNLYIGIGFGGGLGLGLPIAGYLCQFMSWRVIFYWVAAIGALIGLSCLAIPKKKLDIPLKPFDLYGFLSLATGIAALLIALSNGALASTTEGWRSPFILFFFALSAVAFLSFIAIEWRHENPIVPLSLFKDPIFSVSAVALFLLGMAIFAGLSVTTNFMIDGLGYEKYVTGKVGMWYGFAIAFCSILASLLSKKIPVPVLAFSGLSLLVASYFLNNRLDFTCGPDQVIPILILRGIGVGLALGPATAQAMAEVPTALRAPAATILTYFRQIGATFGGTAFQIFTIKRSIFHTSLFGQTVNEWLPAYQTTAAHLQNRLANTVSEGIESGAIAKGIVITLVQRQAFIQALNDGCLIFGWVTLFVALILILVQILKKVRAEVPPSPLP